MAPSLGTKQVRDHLLVGLRFVTVFAALGMVIALLGRSGGGGHSCPAGSPSSACSYPHGPWHWLEGLLIGGAAGLVAFAVYLTVQRYLRNQATG